MDEPQVALGERIRKLREKAGLTQEQLAERAGLSLKHLGELERGRANPSFSSIKNLAHAFTISVSEIFDYEHEQLSAREIRSEICQMAAKATDEECKLIYRILRALLR